MSRPVLILRAVLLVASVLLGLGLVAPCMTIRPSFGGFTGWVQLLRPDLTDPTTYSILSGILELMRNDSLWLGLLLLAFSVAFPAIKLATLWWGVSIIKAGRPGGWVLAFTHHAGKFSMLDVMVIALLVVAIKGLPGDTRVDLGWGVFAFAGSVILSMLASVLAKRLEAASVASMRA